MRTFCDHAAWLRNGKVVDVGEAMTIVDSYANAEHGVRIVETGGTRFGSGEATITGIEWLVDGVDTRTTHTGDHVRLRLNYHSEIEIPRPTFGASIDTRDGVFVWGHHSLDAGYVAESIRPGHGSIDIDIPALPLRPGTFDVSASIQDHTATHVFDALQKAVRVDVLSGDPMESGGVTTFGSTFTDLTPRRPLV